MEDYYKVLGIQSNSTNSDIKKAYRKLSLKHHPDKNGGGEVLFKKINEAYQILGNVEKRKTYDIQKNNPFYSETNDHMMPNPHDFLNMMFGGMPFNFGDRGMDMGMGMPQVRIFRNGIPVNMSGMQKPSPIIKSINITLEQAYTGMNYPLKIEKWAMVNNVKHIENETIYVDIKAGIDDNEIILIRNRGNVINENNQGDIKLFIKVINNTIFTRDGLDLLFTKEITLKEALVGFSFDFKHLTGKTYTINNKTGKVVSPDFIKEVQNMGMRRERSHPASPLVGNLLICFKINYPNTLNKKQREQLDKIL